MAGRHVGAFSFFTAARRIPSFADAVFTPPRLSGFCVTSAGRVSSTRHASSMQTIVPPGEPSSELDSGSSGQSMNRTVSAPTGQNGSAAPQLGGTAFAKRSVRLSAPLAAQLIRDAVGGGGEVWARGSGQSMFPTIRHDDLVLLSPLRRSIRRGDIVLVPLGRGLMLHRVVRMEGPRVITRGDARAADDIPILASDVVARAVAVRHGDRVSALIPSARFGLAALFRFLIESTRRRARFLNTRWRQRRRLRKPRS